MSLPTHPEPDPHADPLVASVLRAADGAAAGACPDAELLALYAERDLGGAEHTEVESHVHACARCQAMVAALVRAMPDPAAPSAVEAERAPGGGFVAWFAGWRWLVPAASLTAVAVVAVWVGRGPADQVAESSGVTGEAANRKFLARSLPAPSGKTAAESQDLLAASRAEPAATAAPPAAALGFEARAGREQAAKAPARGAGVRPAAPVAPSAERAAETQAKAAAAADVRTETSALVGSAVRDDAAGGAQPLSAEQRAENASARQRASAAAAVAPPPPPPPAAMTPAAPARGTDPVFRANLTAASWRVRQGVVERTRDDGAWERVTVPAGATVIAVAAVSADACWAITADAVFTVTDGVTWTRTARPPAAPLTNVSATSARAATVTAGGTPFVTTDGGATWAPVR